jgi:hypothetical protein
MAGDCPCCGKPIAAHPASGRENLARLLYEAEARFYTQFHYGPWGDLPDRHRRGFFAIADALAAAGYRRAES